MSMSAVRGFRYRFDCLLLAMPLFMTGGLQADVAYTTFGTSDTHQSVSYNIGPTHNAFEFESSKTGTLASIDVATLLIIDAGADALEFVLWSDGGTTPGTPLWSGSVDPEFSFSIQSMPGGSGAPTLTTGTEYWLSARSMNGVDNYGWAFNDQSISGAGATDATGGTNWVTFSAVMPAFRVTVVPEPHAGFAMLSFVLGMGLRRRRLATE